MSLPCQIGICLEYFPHINIHCHCRMMYSKLYGNGIITVPRLMGSNNCLSKLVTDTFPFRHCINIHLTPPDQTAKTSNLNKEWHDVKWHYAALPLTDVQLTKYLKVSGQFLLTLAIKVWCAFGMDHMDKEETDCIVAFKMELDVCICWLSNWILFFLWASYSLVNIKWAKQPKELLPHVVLIEQATMSHCFILSES